MTTKRTLKPAGGRLVRHPDDDKRALKPDGEVIELTSYWRRKLNAGDVIDVTTEPVAAEAEKAPKGGAK